MPQPTRMHIDAPLTNMSVAFDQQDSAFIFDKVFPVLPVDNLSDKFWEFPLEDWLRDEAQRRAGGTESAGGGFGVNSGAYSCDTFAWHKDIDDQTKNSSDSMLQLDRAATSFVVNRLRMKQERQFLADFFGTGKWGTDLTGTAADETGLNFIQWSNPNTSSPLKTIKRAKRAIVSQTGLMPNVLTLGYDVYDALTDHPDILDRVKYTSSDAVTKDVLARYFEVDKVLVSESVVNTAQEGLAASTDFNLGKVALLSYSAPEPGLMTPTAGYQFRWKGVSQGLGTTIGTKRFRMEHLASDRIEGEVSFDNKIISAPLGVYLSGVVA